MPGSKVPNKPNRYIYSELKTKRLVWEEEKPFRWPYMKILREFSSLKEFYPDITPYYEAYHYKKNLWALFSESLDGMGDPWSYVLEGPEKILIVDTAFGLRGIKELAYKLTGHPDKEIIVVNTHRHFDHAYGNAAFDKCYCHEDEVFGMKKTAMNPQIWDYLFDENGKPIWTEFDRNDLIEYKDYELIGLKSNQTIDLGQGYLVEAVPMRGHSAGQCGYLDLQNHYLFTGDINSIARPLPGDPAGSNCTVERQRDDIKALVDRIDEIEGVYSGHGPLDLPNNMLKYHLYALEQILANPDQPDKKVAKNINGKEIYYCEKYIYQNSKVSYFSDCVYYKDFNK